MASPAYQGKHFQIQIIGPAKRQKAIIGKTVKIEADGMYMILPVRLTNTSQIPRYDHIYKPSTCLIITAAIGGCESDDTYAGLGYYDSLGRFWDHGKELAPGEAVDTWLIFDVPETYTSPVMRIYYEYYLASDIVAEVPLLLEQ
jgi:hypothetical protein